jgi:hypothetical protein
MINIHRFLDARDEPIKPRSPIEGYEDKLLVSLEEAIERIKPFVTDLDRQVWLAKLGSSNPENGLNVNESAAIRLYTMQWVKSHESLYV